MVGYDGSDFSASAGDFLYGAVGFASTFCGVENYQLAHSWDAVVARDNGEDARGMVGKGPGVKGGVRPV